MRIAIPKESHPGENRVPITPESAKKLCRMGAELVVETGLGSGSGFADSEYVEAGATVSADRNELFRSADVLLRLRKPAPDEIRLMKRGCIHISYLDPFNERELVTALKEAGITAISMEMIPRTTRSQKMDALSSQANLAGYVMVLQAATHLPRIFPMMMTPAGTLKPANVFVIGAGVAGLQAIATAKRLGARVTAFDTRPVVAEQVQSLGAKFLEIDLGETGQTAGGYALELTPEQVEKQRQAQKDVIAKSDVVITTAQVFGRKPPVLVTKDMVEGMAPGSVIVDMAAETGGNVEGSVPNEIVKVGGVTIIGKGNLAGEVARHASQMYSANLFNLVEDNWNEEQKQFVVDFDDDILPGCIITHGGEVVNETIKKIMEGVRKMIPAEVFLTFILMLSIFLGFELINKVPATLHTPLMSGANAISGITLVGAISLAGNGEHNMAEWLGVAAVALATINVVGGYLVTDRMLAMFKKKGLNAMDSLIQYSYVVAAALFIYGLKLLGSPATARRGNMISAVGMLLAVVAALLAQGIEYQWVALGILVGAVIGGAAARMVQMTAMPEMVALFNGFGGMASLLVGWAALVPGSATFTLVTIILSILIGGVTFTGSMIAYGKLSERIGSGAVLFSGQQIVNSLIVLGILAGAVMFCLQPDNHLWLYLVVVLSLVFGVMAVIPIGGADMPVVISLLNSYSGLAACAAGFAVNNNILIVAGALVGASGIILTQIMCKAMNRSLANVLFSGFGSGKVEQTAVEGEIKPINVEDAYYILEAASNVAIIPGYGMAVAQAQHVVKELAELLEKNGAEVNFGIHPVAGRMPGHMNVLLAEADVPYDQLLEMDDINPRMENVDVAIVIGANDVVNPAARENEGSPIYGMPVINVDKARTVFVLKRSMASGFAGIENPLFYKDNTRMLFGDAKESIGNLIREFSG